MSSQVRAKKPLQLGTLLLQPPQEVPLRIALLLWGEPGVGKTTFAATAPGHKLWINLDPDGTAAIAHRKDFHMVDLSDMSSNDVIRQLKSNNPLDLDRFLGDEKNKEFETVVFDSATALFVRCQEVAVEVGYGKSKHFTPSIEAPGITAYGARTNLMVYILQRLLRVTGKHNRHIIIIAHEGSADMDSDGHILKISTSLSDKTIKHTTFLLSEIWYMSDEGRKRRVAVRSTRLRTPMKTRMFDASDAPEFTLDYDARSNKAQKHTISAFYDEWLKRGGDKLPLP